MMRCVIVVVYNGAKCYFYSIERTAGAGLDVGNTGIFAATGEIRGFNGATSNSR